MSYYDLSSREAGGFGVATDKGGPFAEDRGDRDNLSVPRGMMFAAMLGLACWTVILTPLLLLLG